MKITGLQEILEHYKQKNGDLEVRLVMETRNGEEHYNLNNAFIGTTEVYDEQEFNNLVNNIGLTEQQAFNILKESKLAKTCLDIYIN